MSKGTHRLILASLLAAFALINASIGLGMLRIIPFQEFEADDFSRTVGWVVYTAVLLSVALYAVQLLGAAMLLRGGESSRNWGLVGSVIAVLGGVSLPVGIYGLWLLASRSGWKVDEQ